MQSSIQNHLEKKIKILIVTTVPETLHTILRDQPKHLADFFDIQLVTSPDPVCVDIERVEGVPVHKITMSRGISPLLDLISIFRMWLLFLSHRPNIVHSYTPKAGLIAMIAAWITFIPIRVHTFTGLIFPTQKGWKKKLLINVDRLICGCATTIVPEGLGIKRDLLNNKITKKRLEIIGNGNIAGVDISFFDPDAPCVLTSAHSLRDKLNLASHDNFVFCFIGRLNKDKGISELLAAFRLLPENAHLLVVGKIDETSPISTTEIESLDTHPRIHHIGFQSDIRAALKLASIVVLPSYREGFPNVLLQAGAMRVPAIATDINGSNEIISNDFNGWLIPPKNYESLANAMKQALEKPKFELERMGRNARENIIKNFDRKIYWQKLRAFYTNLLNASYNDETRP
ncbi:glycosyltransferase family 4 protein [Pigmentiphaga sp. D-2]|uniref:glycosyltransferase family 4 protein n=1 Tax=Pigmentiphaga sp. D-2 TaxID=1002116 RepID=UPI00104F635F|nr:glycosyltransferase family 4 protein [Pigmentiphaga sp. D-2]